MLLHSSDLASIEKSGTIIVILIGLIAKDLRFGGYVRSLDEKP